jgi:hypothetical protein
MYKFIRNTHLILGMASLLFVLLYAVSAAQMAHQIRLTPRVEDEDVILTPGLAARSLADALMRERGYGGELGQTQMTPTGFRVNVTRPGTLYAVNYNRTSGMAHVRRETRSFMGMLNRLHHQHGLHHADGVLNAWGWALLAVSLAMIFIGASGVYLWFKIRQERVIGAVLLGVNVAISVGLLAVLRV